MVDAQLGGLTGTILALRYRLIRLVKEGGMGAVYEAEDTKLGRRVAVKVLSPQFTQQPDMVRRFFREAKAPSFAQHPNIVEYLDFDQIAGGVAYLVMEYLQGDDLERVLKRRGPLPWPELAQLMLQSCRALVASHAAGIIHRDIKPSNFILLDRTFDTDTPLIKLIDFGIAKFTEDSRLHSHTEVTQHLMGSQRFIAPEMYAMVPANPRTDIYALGVTMFRLLTGRYPEASGGYDMTPPSAVRPDAEIPPEADALILRAIHVNPYARFETMAEVEQEIAALLRRPAGSGEPAPVLLTTVDAAGQRSTGPLPVIGAREPSSATVALRRPPVWPYVASTAVLTAIVAGLIVLLMLPPSPPPSESRPSANLIPSPAAHTPPPTIRSDDRVEAPPAAPQDSTPPENEPTAASETIPSATPQSTPPPAATEALAPLDKNVVHARMRTLASKISECGKASNMFGGMSLQVEVRVRPDGKTQATLKQSGVHRTLQTCVDRVIESQQFAPSAGARVVHSFKI